MKHLVKGTALAGVAYIALSAHALADGQFVVNAVQPPSTLDPAFACDIIGNGYVAPLYAPLLAYERKKYPGPEGVTVTREDDENIVPALAESYEVSEDGLTYSFKIRPDMKFASDNPLDAAAVAASLNRALKSGGCGTYYMEVANMGNTQSIEAEGDTVLIKLAKPEPLLIHALTQPNLSIVDVTKVDEMGGKDWLANNAAGSGPYILDSYKPGVQAVYKANPNYFGEQPKESEIVLNFISDPSALLLQARNGGADVTLGLPKQMVDQVKDEMNVVTVPSPRFMIVGFPTKIAPFDNQVFREALSYAVPYEAIEKFVAYEYARSFFGPFPPEFSAYNKDVAGVRVFNMEKAQELLEQSGVKTPVQMPMTILEGSTEYEHIATILQGAWKKLGVEVSISKLSSSAYVETVTSPEKKTAILRFDGPSLADPAWLLNYDMRCESPYNQSNYCSEEAEGLLNEALAIDNLEERQAKWDEIAQIWIKDVPRIPVYADTYTAVLNKGVASWDFAQDGPFDIQYWGR